MWLPFRIYSPDTKIADLKVSSLISHLSTVKAALNQLANLLESDLGALRDSKLIDEFSTSLGSVEAVVLVLDEKMSLVQRDTANGLTARSRISFMWDEKSIEDCLSLLTNQTQALNLLLTVFQWFVTKGYQGLLPSFLKTDHI